MKPKPMTIGRTGRTAAALFGLAMTSAAGGATLAQALANGMLSHEDDKILVIEGYQPDDRRCADDYFSDTFVFVRETGKLARVGWLRADGEWETFADMFERSCVERVERM